MNTPIRLLASRRRQGTRLLVCIAATFGAVGALLVLNAGQASSAGCRGRACAAKVGLVGIFTHKTNCKGHITDPVNVLWYSQTSGPGKADATPARIADDIQFAAQWTNDDAHAGPFGIIHEADFQGVEEYYVAPQFSKIQDFCHVNDTQRANDIFYAPNRQHVRLFASSLLNRQYVTGDAHMDHTSDKCGPAVVIYSYYLGKIVFHKHESVNFDRPRDDLLGSWKEKRIGHEHYDFFGNTEKVKNCDGNGIHSDGRVAALRAFNHR